MPDVEAKGSMHPPASQAARLDLPPADTATLVPRLHLATEKIGAMLLLRLRRLTDTYPLRMDVAPMGLVPQ